MSKSKVCDDFGEQYQAILKTFKYIFMSAKGFEITQYIPLMHYCEQKMAVGLLYSGVVKDHGGLKQWSRQVLLAVGFVLLG